MEDLFLKFINNTIVKEEFDVLMAWIENPRHKNEVAYVLDMYWSHLDDSTKLELLNRSDDETDLLFYQIMHKIESKEEAEKSDKRFPEDTKSTKNTIFRVAATILLIVGAFFFYQNSRTFENEVHTEVPVLDPNAITIVQSDGNIKVVSENGEEKIINKEGDIVGSQKGTQISYSNSVGLTKGEELAYNVLTVPYGKLAALELSDGTKITLNAGTSIKYPERFLKGLPREVFLLRGEAYFEVTKDKAHPFILNSGGRNIEVLGTSFNVSNYSEDHTISTVLVEGAVRLYENDKKDSKEEAIPLTPGFGAIWNKTSKKMSIKKVDTHLYTAWKDGLLVFRKSSYENIRKKLERHFDIVIDNKYQFLDEQVYTATFSTSDNTIEEILEAFKEDTPFRFTRTDNKITINQ